MNIRFGTFNLYQFCKPPYCWYTKKEKFSQEQWNEKVLWIKNQILEMNCDVIGFQEVFSVQELKEICEELGFKYFINVDEAKLNDNQIYTSTTVALASKHPILNIKKIKVHIPSIKKHKFKGKFSFSRIPIKALIKFAKDLEITVYVNHFKSNRLNEFEYIFSKEDSLNFKKQKVKVALENDYSLALKQRLVETSSLYFDLKRCKTPVILMCDLNDKEYSLSIDALTNKAYHEEYIKYNSYLLHDAYYLCKKEIYNPHPTKTYARIPTSYYQGYGNVIDYIFISKEFDKKNKKHLGYVSNYEVFDKHLHLNKDGSLLNSDHAQVVCAIEILR